MVGSLVHSCLESYFRSGSYLPEIRKWRDKEFKLLPNEEQILNGDIIPLVKTLLRGYISLWKKMDLEMIWVEKEFEVEIAPGIFLIGKIDGLAKDKSFTWLVEHKTCKKMPGEEVRMFDTQAILYSKVLNELGEDAHNGVIWDYIRTKLPVKPELLAKGGLSTRKNIDTTPEVYLAEIKRHGFDPENYTNILSELEDKRSSFYRQVRLPLNKNFAEVIWNEAIITAQLLQELEERHYNGEEVFTRNLTRDCSWCDYSSLCHAELRGEDTEYLLRHDFIRR